MKQFVYELHDPLKDHKDDIIWRYTDTKRRILILTCKEEEINETKKEISVKVG